MAHSLHTSSSEWKPQQHESHGYCPIGDLKLGLIKHPTKIQMNQASPQGIKLGDNSNCFRSVCLLFYRKALRSRKWALGEMAQSLRDINNFCIFRRGSMLGGSQLPENPASEDLVASVGTPVNTHTPHSVTYSQTQSSKQTTSLCNQGSDVIKSFEEFLIWEEAESSPIIRREKMRARNRPRNDRNIGLNEHLKINMKEKGKLK